MKWPRSKTASMKGFIVSDFLDRRPRFVQEVGGYSRAGKLKNAETVVSGIEQAVPAFIGLFAGKPRQDGREPDQRAGRLTLPLLAQRVS